MQRWMFLSLVVALAGCAYVTKGEFDEIWDADEDGWPIGEDCDDGDDPQLSPLIHPGVPDVRGDTCDADCGGLEADADGDDWPDDADCAPDDPAIYPCARPDLNADGTPDADVLGDGVDHDCDGEDTPRTDSCLGWDPSFTDENGVIIIQGQNRFVGGCTCPAPAFGDCPGRGD